jgi:hypothetical protein
MTTSNSNKPEQSMAAVKLSYSSMKTLQSCEARYFNYKVLKTPYDKDYEESNALGLGKAFHEVLEKTNHNSWNESLLISAMVTHNVDSSDKELLSVMLEKYVTYHKASGLKVIKCELGLETNNYVGFLDAIAIEGNKFWIIDLKTAARHDVNLLPQLAKDMQMNLYAHFADQIELAVPEVEGKEFAGCRYRQVIKSKATTPRGLESGVKVYDLIIPASVLNPDEAWSLFLELHEKAHGLHRGDVPKKNFSSCMAYFSACPYFSQCHKSEFTSGNTGIIVQTIDTLKEVEDLL